MATLTEKNRPTEVIISESNHNISRDQVTIVSGAGVVAAGTVLGRITASGKFTPSTDGGATGAQTAVAVSLYEVDATSADQKVAVISRTAEVNGKTLRYDASVNDDAKKAAKATQLAAVGIIVR